MVKTILFQGTVPATLRGNIECRVVVDSSEAPAYVEEYIFHEGKQEWVWDELEDAKVAAYVLGTYIRSTSGAP